MAIHPSQKPKKNSLWTLYISLASSKRKSIDFQLLLSSSSFSKYNLYEIAIKKTFFHNKMYVHGN